MDDEEDGTDWSSYNIVSKRKSIEHNYSAASSSNNNRSSSSSSSTINDDTVIPCAFTASATTTADTCSNETGIIIDNHDDNSYIVDTKKKAVKVRFYSDIEEMMYGFGDDWPPLRDSVNLLDAIAVKYIEDLGEDH